MTAENIGQNQVAICKMVKVVRENDDINTVYLEGPAEQFAGEKRASSLLSVSMPGADGWSRMHPFTISSAPSGPAVIADNQEARRIHLGPSGHEAGNAAKMHGATRCVL